MPNKATGIFRELSLETSYMIIAIEYVAYSEWLYKQKLGQSDSHWVPASMRTVSTIMIMRYTPNTRSGGVGAAVMYLLTAPLSLTGHSATVCSDPAE